MAGNETVFQRPIKYSLFLVDQSLSFPTAGQGNDDSGNEIAKHLVYRFRTES